MSMRLVMAGYLVSLIAAMAGCIVVARSRSAFAGLNWLIGSILTAFVGVILLAGRTVIPDFASIVVANEAILASFVLFQLAIVAILRSTRRYLLLSAGIGIALLVAFLYFTYVSNNFSARILVRTAAVFAQVLISTVVLFRHRDPALRSPIRVAGGTLVAFNTVQAMRFIVTLIWPPLPGILHPDPLQAFFSFLNCILGLGIVLALLWLALWSRQRDLQTMALTDALTGLINRRAFDEIIERELGRCQQSWEPLALLLIDIDSFKAINDDYGHLAGDEVIRQVGYALEANAGDGDIVGRYGGEEFVMVLRDLSLDEAEAVAEGLRMQVAALRELPQGIHVTVSIGLAIFETGDTCASLLKRSDDALYFAKRSGRNRVSVGLTSLVPEAPSFRQ